MPCDCPAFECIELYVSACDTGIDTGIVAPADGVYHVRLKFNGAYTVWDFELEVDDTLILPNVVNGNYVHELQVYNPDGALLNDTCYNLDVRTVINSGNDLEPSPIV